jgi:hypothetical protein
MAMLNAFLDVRSNACYTQTNVGQDHSLDSDDRRAFRGSNGRCRAIMHPREHAKSKSLSAKLLREQDLLRDIAEEHGSVVRAACERRFQPTAKGNQLCYHAAFLKL